MTIWYNDGAKIEKEYADGIIFDYENNEVGIVVDDTVISDLELSSIIEIKN